MGFLPEEIQDLREEYGPDAVFTQVGNILIVHLDRPTESMIRERIAEIQREANEPDDCPLCEKVRLQGGYTVVYHGNSLLQEEN